MTEKEYMDVTDLQLLRSALNCLCFVNALHMPNKSRVASIRENIRLSISHLEENIGDLTETN